MKIKKTTFIYIYVHPFIALIYEYGQYQLHEKNITPTFFDLKTGLAGEILQKFANYRVRLVIVGEFSKYPGQSIKNFIFESNKGKHVNFLPSTETAIEKLSAAVQ